MGCLVLFNFECPTQDESANGVLADDDKDKKDEAHGESFSEAEGSGGESGGDSSNAEGDKDQHEFTAWEERVLEVLQTHSLAQNTILTVVSVRCGGKLRWQRLEMWEEER